MGAAGKGGSGGGTGSAGSGSTVFLPGDGECNAPRCLEVLGADCAAEGACVGQTVLTPSISDNRCFANGVKQLSAIGMDGLVSRTLRKDGSLCSTLEGKLSLTGGTAPQMFSLKDSKGKEIANVKIEQSKTTWTCADGTSKVIDHMKCGNTNDTIQRSPCTMGACM